MINAQITNPYTGRTERLYVSHHGMCRVYYVDESDRSFRHQLALNNEHAQNLLAQIMRRIRVSNPQIVNFEEE